MDYARYQQAVRATIPPRAASAHQLNYGVKRARAGLWTDALAHLLALFLPLCEQIETTLEEVMQTNLRLLGTARPVPIRHRYFLEGQIEPEQGAGGDEHEQS